MSRFDTHTLLIAQDGSASPPTEGSLAPSNGAGGGAGQSGSSSPLSGSFMFIVIGMVVVMLIITSMGPRRERKRREAMLSAISKHDRVQTVGGVIGSIVELKPDFVVLKVDESSNTRITFARSSIQQVLSSSKGDAAPSIAAKDA